MSKTTEHKCEGAKAAYEEVEEVIKQHSGKPGDLIQVLHFVQERLGYVPKDVQVKIAEELEVPLSEVYGVITFYSLFRENPTHKYVISLCQGTACYVRGAPDTLKRLEQELGIKAGGTTDDGMFTLEVVRCLGACALAPVMTVNKDTHGRVTEDKVPAILDLYRKKAESEAASVAGS